MDIRVLETNGLVKDRDDEVFGLTGWKWVGHHDLAWQYIIDDWNNYHRAHITRLFPDGGRTVIQAGGNAGLYPLLLSQHFQAVYTFEPDPILFHCLVNNNQVGNVVPINGALGARHGFINVQSFAADNCGMKAVQQVGYNSIPMYPIDSYGFRDVDLIFLDTEGYEVPALIGAAKTIKEWKPAIILELDQLNGPQFNQADGMLAEHGYRAPRHIGPRDFLFVHKDKPDV